MQRAWAACGQGGASLNLHALLSDDGHQRLLQAGVLAGHAAELAAALLLRARYGLQLHLEADLQHIQGAHHDPRDCPCQRAGQRIDRRPAPLLALRCRPHRGGEGSRAQPTTVRCEVYAGLNDGHRAVLHGGQHCRSLDAASMMVSSHLHLHGCPCVQRGLPGMVSMCAA